MLMKDAMTIIEAKEGGFMVHFEKRKKGTFTGDYFPDKHAGEELIPTEEEAWELAKKFAKATNESEYVNIYVIDHNFKPVKGYGDREIRRYIP